MDAPIARNEDDGDPVEAKFIKTNMKAITPDKSNTLASLPKEKNGSNGANDEGEDRVKIMTVTVPLITNHGKIESPGDGSFVETNATVLNVISSKDEMRPIACFAQSRIDEELYLPPSFIHMRATRRVS